MSVWQSMDTLPESGEVMLFIRDMPNHGEPDKDRTVHVLIDDGEFQILNDADHGYVHYWTHGKIEGWFKIPEFDR